MAGACEAYRASWPTSGFSPYSVVQSSPTCITADKNGSQGPAGSYATRTATPVTPTYSCPAGGTLSGTTCTCSSTYTETGGTCVPRDIAKEICDTMNASGLVYSAGTTLGLTACDTGISITGSMGTVANGKNYLWPPFSCKSTGCTGGGTGSTVPAPETSAGACAPPKVASVVVFNGVSSTVCYTPTTSTTQSTKTDTTTSKVGTGATQTGGETTTKGTVCTGASCTTTTTTTKTDGAGVQTVNTSDKTQDKPSFCAENPDSPMCVKSTYAGNCDAPPVCTGDAVQCAIAAQTLATKCALTTAPTGPVMDAAAAAAARPLGDETAGLAGNRSVSIGPGTFNTAPLIGAATGLSDLQVTVFRSQVTLPFSSINIWLERLGVILQAVTFLLCIRIVGRG
jgi:hypothetical protein